MLNNVIVTEIEASSIIVSSKIPDSDFVINPYIGCQHACGYCYAQFMKKYSGHNDEEWGKFVDVKINAQELVVNKKRYQGKRITLSSVTDPYQPIEEKYKLTRKILEKLILLEPILYIITKSSLVLRDTDLLKQFKNCTVAFSLSIFDDNIRKRIEPYSSTAQERINTLKKLYQAGLKAALFISPFFPYITDWKELIEKTKGFVSEFWFSNLNLYAYVRGDVGRFLSSVNVRLNNLYNNIYSGNKASYYWLEQSKIINDYCKNNNLKCKIYL